MAGYEGKGVASRSVPKVAQGSRCPGPGQVRLKNVAFLSPFFTLKCMSSGGDDKGAM